VPVRAAIAVGAVGALALSMLRRRIFVVTVKGGSMEPSLRDGDRLVCRRAGIHDVRRGDVVVLERPGTDKTWLRPPPGGVKTDRELLIKRAVAVPGDHLPRTTVPALADRTEAVVPPGQLVVLGDNVRHSFDSKQIGYIPSERLLGVAVRRLRAAPSRLRTSSSSEVRSRS
jgi:signal peptidase I